MVRSLTLRSWHCKLVCETETETKELPRGGREIKSERSSAQENLEVHKDAGLQADKIIGALQINSVFALIGEMRRTAMVRERVCLCTANDSFELKISPRGGIIGRYRGRGGDCLRIRCGPGV